MYKKKNIKLKSSCAICLCYKALSRNN